MSVGEAIPKAQDYKGYDWIPPKVPTRVPISFSVYLEGKPKVAGEIIPSSRM